MHSNQYKKAKIACYSSYFTMTSAFCVPPLLFVTLRELYGISYTLLGSLVLVNFCTQLLVDLIFTVFAKRFNLHLTARIMPCVTTLGMLVFALVPTFFPNYAYVGLLVGSIIFAVAAGLSEVLLSPIIAAIPSDNPAKEMSLLHSLYAFGVFTTVIFSTLFLRIFGHQYWNVLMILLALLPLFTAYLFVRAELPPMSSGEQGTESSSKGRPGRLGIVLCVLCIFFGSCAECCMSSWISGFMETSLGISKAVGDVMGVAMFAILLGAGRIGFSRYGKHIMRVLFIGMIGAAACYFTVALSGNVIVAFIACIFTGLFTSMLWPGSLIMMEENIPGVGVAAFALMAAGGDLGGSVSPQLMGIVIDKVSVVSGEAAGMKAGMLVCGFFPLIGAFLVAVTMRYFFAVKRKKLVDID